MKAKTCYFVFLSLLSFHFTLAQTSGVSLTTSVENRNIPYFNNPSYINAYTLNIGIDKCIGNSLVWYIGFRYANSFGKHNCTECGVFNSIERATGPNLQTKSYYRYDEVKSEVGIPISVKYYFATHKYSSIQFFAELGFVYDIFTHTKWEGEYWKNDYQTQAVIEGPFEENNHLSEIDLLDATAMASVGAELTLNDGWAMIVKPYLQYDGNWTMGGMVGVKRVVDNGY